MNYSDLFVYVAPYVGNCPRMVMEHHIRLAAIEFFGRTHAWMETLSIGPTVVGTSSYSLGLPTGSDLVRIFTVDVGADVDVPVLSAYKARLALSRQSSSPFVWTPDMLNLSVSPAPSNATDLITVQASLKPDIASTSMPDVQGVQNAVDIAHGALASLLRMPRVDWRDPQASADELARFNSAIAVASRQKTKGYATQRMRTTRFY